MDRNTLVKSCHLIIPSLSSSKSLNPTTFDPTKLRRKIKTNTYTLSFHPHSLSSEYSCHYFIHFSSGKNGERRGSERMRESEKGESESGSGIEGENTVQTL